LPGKFFLNIIGAPYRTTTFPGTKGHTKEKPLKRIRARTREKNASNRKGNLRGLTVPSLPWGEVSASFLIERTRGVIVAEKENVKGREDKLAGLREIPVTGGGGGSGGGDLKGMK